MQAYHRLVKTTPKPSATKKSKGELVGPPPPPPPPPPPLVGVGSDVVGLVVDIATRSVSCMYSDG